MNLSFLPALSAEDRKAIEELIEQNIILRKENDTMRGILLEIRKISNGEQ